MEQTTNTSSALTNTKAAPGYWIVKTPSPTTNRSSAILTNQLDTGSGLILTTARVLAFVRWDPVATAPPSNASSASVVGATVIGAAVVGATVVGATVIGAAVVGAVVVPGACA